MDKLISIGLKISYKIGVYAIISSLFQEIMEILTYQNIRCFPLLIIRIDTYTRFSEWIGNPIFFGFFTKISLYISINC